MTTIINQGRCPRIAGTRITVYDVMDYLQAGWSEQGTEFIHLISREQVVAAKRYIEEHRNEVMAVYQRILERDAAGNPPELQSRLDATHKRVQEMIRQRQLAKESQSAGAGGGRQH